MTAPTKWRINATANNGDANFLGIGSLELRSTAGVARPFVRDFFTVTANNTGTANILGAASLTPIVSAFEAYSWHQVTFSFPVILGGVSYTTCVVTSDGQISFGENGTTYGYDYFQVENLPKGFPSIIHSPGADSGFSGFKKLYAGAENSGTTFRIRLEMFAQDTDPGGAADTVWEVTFDSAAPNVVRLDFDTSAYAAAAYGLIAYVSDGYYRAQAATFGAGVVNKGYDVNFNVTTAEGTATASTHTAPDAPPYGNSYDAEQACDNTVNTGWLTASGNTTGWLQYEFNSPFAVAEYVVSAPSHPPFNALNQQAKDWTLEYWDGSSWAAADTQSGQASWSYSEARTFTLPPPPSNDGDITLYDPMTAGLLSVPDNTLVGIEITMEALTASGAITVNNSVGDISLPAMTVSATGYPHQMLYGGDLAIATPTLEGSLEGPLPLPMMSVEGICLAGTISIGVARLQRMTMAQGGSMEPPLPLPELSVSGDMISGAAMTADVNLSPASADGVMLAGGIGEGALTLPLLHVEGGPEGDISLPLLDVAGTAISGSVSTGALIMSRLALVADGAISYADGTANGQIELAEWTVSGTGESSSVIDGAVTFSAFAVSGHAVSGSVSTGTLTLPLMALDADGFSDAIGTAELTLPLLSVDGLMQSAMPAPVFTSVVLNTQSKAACTYSGLAINSLANFGGLTLAATASGIVALIGDSDDGAPINALVTGGVSDLGVEQYKRVLCAFVGYRAGGDMEMTMITDQHHEFIYQLVPRQMDHAHASRVKFGQGAKGRYWQWKLANKSGADFALDSVALDVEVLSRRTA